MVTEQLLKGINIFGVGTYIEEFDFYWIVYESGRSLDQKSRKKLKRIGWRLQRHSRTNKEMWVLDKPGSDSVDNPRRSEMSH